MERRKRREVRREGRCARQLARARRRDQEQLVADILEDMDVVRARATEAG